MYFSYLFHTHTDKIYHIPIECVYETSGFMSYIYNLQDVI